MNDTKTYYITSQGAKIGKTGNRLYVEFKNNDRKTLRIDLINNIVIYGSSLVTTPIMNFIVRKGISLAYLSKTGKFKACVIPPVSKNIFRRISQYKIFSDEASRIEFAKEVVKAKIINQLHFIQEYNNHKPIENFHEYKRNTMTYIEILGLAEKSESILGIEGIASKDYFAMLKKIILWPVKKALENLSYSLILVRKSL